SALRLAPSPLDCERKNSTGSRGKGRRNSCLGATGRRLRFDVRVNRDSQIYGVGASGALEAAASRTRFNSSTYWEMPTSGRLAQIGVQLGYSSQLPQYCALGNRSCITLAQSATVMTSPSASVSFSSNCKPV